MMLCAIFHHLHYVKNLKNNHGGVLLLVKLEAEACNFAKSNIPPWVFFKFFKLYKWYQIAQFITSSLFWFYVFLDGVIPYFLLLPWSHPTKYLIFLLLWYNYNIYCRLMDTKLYLTKLVLLCSCSCLLN